MQTGLLKQRRTKVTELIEPNPLADLKTEIRVEFLFLEFT
jgi:hypothetical protein